jgi:hypothetical protein
VSVIIIIFFSPDLESPSWFFSCIDFRKIPEESHQHEKKEKQHDC